MSFRRSIQLESGDTAQVVVDKSGIHMLVSEPHPSMMPADLTVRELREWAMVLDTALCYFNEQER